MADSGEPNAADLARRIAGSLTDPSRVDEAHRPPSDRPPKFADALMSEAPVSVERGAALTTDDWQLIVRALEYYAAGRSE